MALTSVLKSFDIYRRFDEEQRVQTPKGATITLVGWIIVCLLLISELYSYMSPRITGIISNFSLFLICYIYNASFYREYDCRYNYGYAT